MGKPKKSRKKFNYNKNRRTAWKKSKKLPSISCEQVKGAWNEHQSVQRNLAGMGLCADPNETLPIPTTKEMLGSKAKPKTKKSEKGARFNVVEDLEKEANLPQERGLRLSEQEVEYCTYMMDTHAEDYKAMARDRKNYYQDTPKQIRRKILIFKTIPTQYNEYLESKSKETQPKSAS